MMPGNAPCFHIDGEFCEKCWPSKDKPVLNLDEARKMNFEQLQKFYKEFNNHDLNAEDIQKAWHKQWAKGFNKAIDVVMKCFENYPEKDADSLRDEIIKEINLYLKDC